MNETDTTFKLYDRVALYQTGNGHLDNKTGKILGICYRFPSGDFYIVELDEEMFGNKAVVMTENCLKWVQ